MGEYFKPWRRRFGICTLVIAALVIGGWIRGFKVEDRFIFASGKENFFHKLKVSRVGIMWEKISSNITFQRRVDWDCVEFLPQERLDPSKGFYDPQEFDWQYQWFGFEIAESHDKDYPRDRAVWWLLPYWSIAVPLTVLTAFLLVKKPKTSNQKKTADSIKDEGGGATS